MASGSWAEGLYVTSCPVAMVEHDPVVRLAMETAAWTEQGGAISDLVTSPTVGLLAAVRALRSEFALIKRKSIEAQTAEARANAQAGPGG
jgi:hypothetical protein